MQQQFSSDEIAQAVGSRSVTYLGTGSFGETWRIQTPDRDAAYKIIYRDDSSSERLKREIRSYRRVASTNVVRLDDAFRLNISGRRYATLAFEYIDGGDLAVAITDGQPNSGQLLDLASGLLCGLSALHSAELLHRDLKPANIALRNGDFSHPVILDLGLAKLLDVESITRYPTTIGTPMYMAPEQLRGERAIRASDMWAVGAVLYEAAVGVHPFIKAGENIEWEAFFERLKSRPDIPEWIPFEVSDLISRCLSDPPYKRGTVAKAISRLKGK
ncbi:serine/threonine protein kinase [Streptomyces sp. DK15]|uniref:serine/threonine-protein kinase n=1 Tax=Streptomyces sp. DK15 TaxID=2957499 RepID=UPI0029A2AB13|nr:serine/threonine-protein kinase [Streptomyces sp. DK15]MDX2393426.1 serine/threonine protein kinase [Streptomyces sp. DK15]